MSVNKILKYNRRSSKKLGWEPEWFGCDNIDEDLINKVKEFQQEFDLDVDGYVGPATHRRLLLEREDDDDAAGLLINGKIVSIDWDKVKIDLIKPGCYSKQKRKRIPRMIVTHFDVCSSGPACKRVLENRGISSHFVIDNDGTIIQMVDTNHTAWHAGSVNRRSIGIDISNAYYVKYQKKYTSKGLPPRPIVEDSVVHGRKLKPHLGYYPVQIEAYKALIKVLCKHYKIPLECPLNEDGTLLTGVHGPSSKGNFKGIVNHYNLTRNKIDTAGLKLDEILKELREE